MITDNGPAVRGYYADHIELTNQQAVRRGLMAFALDGYDYGPDVIHGKRLPITG